MWGADGGHPNWHPDGQHLIRVMQVGDAKRLCQFRYDAADFQVLSEKILGGGHPTFEGGGRFIVTDDYQDGPPQQVVIQLIDMQREQVESVCTLPTMPRGDKIEYDAHRLDGHPTWSRDFQQVCFQAAPEGARQLFLADLSRLI